MVKADEDAGKAALDTWIKDVKARHELQLRNIQILETATHLNEANFRSLDSTPKRVNAFMNQLKNIGKTVMPVSLLPELKKLNVSKSLDEIAMNICEVNTKPSVVSSLVEFCVKVSSLYDAFPGVLTAKLKKYVPHKKDDVISDPLKLEVHLNFLADLALNGVIKKDGIQLLAAALSYIINTDKTEHANVNILMPLCRSLLFDLTSLVPLTQLRLAKNADVDIALCGLISPVFSEKQRNSAANLFQSYFDSLVQHAHDVCLEMNNLRNSIKRQELTRGDVSADDRQKFEQVKTKYYQLIRNASDIAEYLGKEMPDLVEQPSEQALEVKRLYRMLDAKEQTLRAKDQLIEQTLRANEQLVDAKKEVVEAKNQLLEYLRNDLKARYVENMRLRNKYTGRGFMEHIENMIDTQGQFKTRTEKWRMAMKQTNLIDLQKCIQECGLKTDSVPKLATSMYALFSGRIHNDTLYMDDLQDMITGQTIICANGLNSDQQTLFRCIGKYCGAVVSFSFPESNKKET